MNLLLFVNEKITFIKIKLFYIKNFNYLKKIIE